VTSHLVGDQRRRQIRGFLDGLHESGRRVSALILGDEGARQHHGQGATPVSITVGHVDHHLRAQIFSHRLVKHVPVDVVRDDQLVRGIEPNGWRVVLHHNDLLHFGDVATFVGERGDLLLCEFAGACAWQCHKRRLVDQADCPTTLVVGHNRREHHVVNATQKQGVQTA